MRQNIKRGWKVFIFIVLFLVIWTNFLFIITPERIVASLGVENTYFVMFLVSLLGGISSLSGVFIYTTLTTFIIGGSNVYLLAVISGFGVFLSDIFFFYLASHSRFILPKEIRLDIDKIYTRLERKRSWAIPYFIILYMGFTPFPSDLLIIPMGLSHYPLKKAIIPIAIAAFCHFALVSFLITRGILIFS